MFIMNSDARRRNYDVSSSARNFPGATDETHKNSGYDISAPTESPTWDLQNKSLPLNAEPTR